MRVNTNKYKNCPNKNKNSSHVKTTEDITDVISTHGGCAEE